MRARAAIDETASMGPRLLVSRYLIYVFCGVAPVVHVLAGQWTYDDAYITFRYVRNIVSGQGFVYNSGEHVLGTTTPLYTLLLSGLELITWADIPALAILVNALAYWVAACVVFRIAYCASRSSLVGLFSALAFSVSGLILKSSVGGMETPLFILAILVAFYLYLVNHQVGSAVACAVATLTRPEGLVVCVLVFGSMTIQRRRLPRRQIAILGSLVLPWVSFATLYFGSPIPQSVSTKASTVIWEGRLDVLSSVLARIGRLISYGVPGLYLSRSVAIALAVVSAACVGAIYAIAVWQTIRRRRRLMPFFLFVPTYAGAYASVMLIRPVPLYEWYFTPVVPFLLIIVMLGMNAIADWLPKRTRLPFTLAAFLLITVTQLVTLNLGRIRDRALLAPVGVSNERVALYRQVALDLAPHINEDTIIASHEIGALGFYSDATILDTYGLVSPQVRGFYPVPSSMVAAGARSAIPPRLIEYYEPEYVVALEILIRESLLQSQYFHREYELIRELETDKWGSRGMLVFRRRDVP